MPSDSPTVYALATPKHIAEPTEAQIDDITAVLQEALKDDPSRPILSGGDPELETLKIRTIVCAAAIEGLLHVLTIPSTPGEQIVGAAVWFPPGTSSSSTQHQRQVGWGAFFDVVEKKQPNLKTWWLEYLIPKFEETYASVLPTNFTKDSWHLLYFGVLPHYQGKGLGKKLFKLAEVQAQSTKTPIVLETGTDLDIAIYRRLGLDVAGEMMIESDYGTQKLTIMVKKWD